MPWRLDSANPLSTIMFRNFIAISILSLSIASLIPGIRARAMAQQLSTTTYEDRDRGIRLYEQRDIEGAIKALGIGIQKFKADVIAWHYLGLSLALKENWKEARKAFEKAVALRPDFAPSRANLAHTLLFTKAIKDAENEANRALSLEPENVEAHYVLGVIRLRQDACVEALAQADAALVSHADFPLAYLLRSQSLLCDIANESLKSSLLDGKVYRASVLSKEISNEEMRSNAKEHALRFKEAAASLELFLKIAPRVPDAAMWKKQLETLRLFAEPAGGPDAERTVFSGVEVTTKARVLSKAEPLYTEAAKRAQVKGTVVLRAIFAKDGKVKNILVLHGLAGGLTEESINAAQKIKFEPATKDGRPVSTIVQLEYNFNLY